MIEVSAKIWRPKVVSRYTRPEYHGDNVNGVLDYGQFVKYLYKNNLSWSDNSGREDIIHFDCQVHNAELQKGLWFDDFIDDDTQGAIVDIIKRYWDYFVQDGTHRPNLGYEFGINTGGAKLVCCRKPSYGPHESKIVMAQVGQLKQNN